MMDDPLCLLCNEPMGAHHHGGKCSMFTCHDPRADEIEALRVRIASVASDAQATLSENEALRVENERLRRIESAAAIVCQCITPDATKLGFLRAALIQTKDTRHADA